MSDSAAVLFGIVGGIAALAWILMLVEWIGTLALSALVFRTGIVVFREIREVPSPAVGGESRFRDTERGLQIRRTRLLSLQVSRPPVRLHPPHAVSGEGHW